MAAPSNFDLNYGIQGRSLPSFGAELYADTGYNQLLWGKKTEPKDVLYGLIRPSLSTSTSAVINSVKGELEFFPISFLGIAAGRQIIHSNFDFPFLDCEEVVCRGEYGRDFIENKMVLGFKGWVLLGNYKIDNLRAPNGKKKMADWRNVIAGDPGHEVQIEKKLLFGKIFSNQMAGVLIENVQFMGSRERKESFAAIYQFKKEETFYMFGAGGFHTDRQPLGFQFYFRIHHVALPSLKLF
jgi:hypothetical protein